MAQGGGEDGHLLVLGEGGVLVLPQQPHKALAVGKLALG